MTEFGPLVPETIRSSVTERRIIFTAQSKRHFYCRDAICEFVFNKGGVPLNPFRAFDYFLNDRVDRDLVREGNNNLIRVADELWVFGTTIANGVLFEIAYAHEMQKPVRLFTVANRAREIRPVAPERLRFESELYSKHQTRAVLLAIVHGSAAPLDGSLRLFDLDDLDAQQDDPIGDTA